jgi:LPXTG-motif cell wall-anchored protein
MLLNRDNKMIVMTEVIWISLVAIALALIAILVVTRKKRKEIKINRAMFAVGLIIALVAALMTFCQERCFLGVDLESWPTVLGIIGIGLIASSNYRLLKSKK